MNKRETLVSDQIHLTLLNLTSNDQFPSVHVLSISRKDTKIDKRTGRPTKLSFIMRDLLKCCILHVATLLNKIALCD